MSKKIFEDNLIPIGEAAGLLGVSVDTLRRWDESGRFRPTRKSEGGTRYYSGSAVELYLNNKLKMAKEWVFEGVDIPQKLHSPTSAIFQARLTKMQGVMGLNNSVKELVPLIVAVTGEIGNNSFDHNIGNWPDIPGVFFGYDISKKQVVLADRGQGILKTLKRVRPSLDSDEEALKVAFTEVLSGRAPESRGNGLKFVKKVVTENLVGLSFKTGSAMLTLKRDGDDLNIKKLEESFHGTLAVITF